MSKNLSMFFPIALVILSLIMTFSGFITSLGIKIIWIINIILCVNYGIDKKKEMRE